MVDEVEAVLRECAPRFRQNPDIVSVDYTKLDGDTDKYLVVFRYVDQEARERFTSGDDLKSTMTILRQIWDLESPIYRGVDMGI